MEYTIRKAKLDDRDALEPLIAASARGLSIEDYSAQQIETAIATVFGVDTDLIVDGTYFVAESCGRLVGCGGWGEKKTAFGRARYSRPGPGRRGAPNEAGTNPALLVPPLRSPKGSGRAA